MGACGTIYTSYRAVLSRFALAHEERTQPMSELPTRAADQRQSNGASLGFESTLWAAADKLRNNLDAAEYKHGDKDAGAYADIPGFCKAATLSEIQGHGYVLTPGRYVGAAEVVADSELFDVKLQRLTATLATQFAESARLEQTIRESLRRVGYTASSEPQPE